MKAVKDHMLAIIVVFMAVAGLVFIGYGFLGKEQQKPPKPYTQGPEEVNKVIAQDRHRLDGNYKTDRELAVAVKRLAVRRDPKLEKKLEEYLNHKSIHVRKAAVEGVGYFSGTSYLKILRESLTSNEKDIRIAALRGLGHKRGEERSSLVREFLKKQGLSSEEQVHGRIAWLQVANEDDDRENAKASLIEMAKSGNGGPLDGAALQLMVLVPRNSEVAAIAREKLTATTTSTAVVIRSIRYLTSVQDSFLEENLETFAKSDNRGVQLAVLDAIRTCPKNWNSVLGALEGAANSTGVTRQIERFKSVNRCQ